MKPLSINLEFTRTAEPHDPHAFQFEPQTYVRRTAGGGAEQFRIEWNQGLLGDLAALRDRRRDPAVVRRVGERLRRALKSAEWSTVEAQLARASRDDRRVLVTIRSNAAELYALPWELITVGAAGAHLGELPGVVLRYEWPRTETTPPSSSPRPEGGRILVAWSAAGGAVPSGEHLEAIERACEDGFVEFDRDRDVVANASAQSLADALAAASAEGRPYGLLHLLAHGGALGSTFGLTLDGGGSADTLDAGRLCRLLAPYASALRLVMLAACDSGNAGALGNHLGSLAQALHRRGLQSVVASRFPLSTAGSTTFTGEFYRSMLVELRSLERAFADARDRLTRREGLDWASVQLYARESDGDENRPVVHRPYRGLEVFGREHQRLFFGRDVEIDEVVGEIEALRSAVSPRLYFVSGASGSGKSSLVRAGVLPRLESRFAEVLVTRPGEDGGGLPTARPLLYVLDQAEELFTVLDVNARRDLIARLHALAVDAAGSVVVFTLRADFIGRLGELVLPDGARVDRLEADDDHRLFLPVANRPSLIAAITGPARLVGLPLQDGLAEQLVDEVAGEPGSLPMLEFALDRMWQRRDPARGLTHAVYRALGGALGALLEREADDAIEAMEPALREQARRLLVQLVATGEGQRADTRRKRRIADVRPATDGAAFDHVVSRLASARLVVTSGGAEPFIEIAHEELLRRWSLLRTWVDEDRQKWIEIERVRSWEHLLRGAELDRAQKARQQYGDDLGPKALAHIGESEAALAEEEANERRQQDELSAAKVRAEQNAREATAQATSARRQSRVALAALVLAIGLSVVAVVFYSRAETARKSAEASAAAKEAARVKAEDSAEAEKEAKDEAKTNLATAERNERLANERLEHANKLASVLLWEILPKLRPIAGTAPVRKEALEKLQELQEALEPGGHAKSLGQVVSRHIARCDVALTHDDLGVARAEVERAVALAEELVSANQSSIEQRHRLVRAYNKLGEVEKVSGDVAAARESHLKALALGQRLAKAVPDSTKIQHDVYVSHVFLGDVDEVRGDVEAARESHLKALAIAERLAKADPDYISGHNNLSLSYQRLGNLAKVSGDVGAAREWYSKSLAIAERLAKADPDHAQHQRELQLSFRLLGGVEERSGNLATARESYAKSLEIAERLAKSDPDNTLAQRDVAISYSLLGDVATDRGDLAAARESYSKSNAILARLAKADPESAGAQRDLSISYDRLGNVEKERGDLAAARELFSKSLAIAERLAKADPDNVQNQSSLCISYQQLASVEKNTGDLAAAREAFSKSLVIADRVAKADPGSVLSQRNLGMSYRGLAGVEKKSGDLAAAREWYTKSLALAERLAKAAPDDTRAQRDLSLSHQGLAEVAKAGGKLAASRESYLKSLAIAERLAEANPSNTLYRNDLADVRRWLAELD